ncbi:flagellar hook protein FlgE [Falsigemmobacter faecalis]|uniref:Flagellar hook protein FlgE n=1 Tax=Falsigemmobacter faecalis TaxID=2488730 RepID=A0A3P3DNP8_9RHOB|nr:flagellar hook protein FlgE [Falsigemmobacter faecalis]RRH75781.1 flagellar hook protein FlgE [Falsigemmobacter faecalis]
MSVSAAMKTAVSGLVANATAVARVSENIANANTIGYKRSFADLVTSTSPGIGSVSGVSAKSGSEISGGGAINSTTNTQDLAVSGTGFFVVSKTPNEPLLSNYFLTRAGSFRQDESGFLVNSAGYYLAAFEIDAATGTLGAVDRGGFGSLKSVKLGEMMLPAEPTTTAAVSGNLPAQETGTATPGAPFLSSMEFYTQLGNSENMTLSWQPTAVDNTWDLTLSDSTGRLHGTVEVAFHNSGATPGAPAEYRLKTPQPDGAAGLTLDAATGAVRLSVDARGDELPITLNLGVPDSYEGVQQFVGDFTPQKFKTDGSAQTALTRTEIDGQGNLTGVFDDGRRKTLYEIPLAQVTNADGLTLIDGNAWTVSRAAGDLSLQPAGSGKNGVIVSGALEASNVEITNELTDLIRVQRAYSSNAKIITTADEMLQEVTGLKR